MSHKRILLIEDNHRDEKLTLAAFQLNNISVDDIKVVRDGVEALEYLMATGQYVGRDTSDCPQLILLDLKMPRLDGLQTLKRIRANENLSMIPVIVLTSSKQEEDIDSSYRLGINSYIRKPVDFNEFTSRVQKIAEYWFEINEPPVQSKRAS